jgi:hypothetical protein
VDNLNPLFLYPEMSKQTELFTQLMQALSRHLRPAPYPYGLLTLRLLGKLGGRNRRFLREPMPLCVANVDRNESSIAISGTWERIRVTSLSPMEIDDYNGPKLSIQLPLKQCLETLRMIVLAPTGNAVGKHPVKGGLTPSDESKFRECNIADLHLPSYLHEIKLRTKREQALACFVVVRISIDQIEKCSSLDDGQEGSFAQQDLNDRKKVDLGLVCQALLYSCMVESTMDDAWALFELFVPRCDVFTFCESFAMVLSETSCYSSQIGLRVVNFFLKKSADDESAFDVLLSSLCNICCTDSWDKQQGPLEAIHHIVASLGVEWKKENEVKVINAALIAVKTTPRELSIVAIQRLQACIRIANALYGSRFGFSNSSNISEVIWDTLCLKTGETEESQTTKSDEMTETTTKCMARPSEEVFRVIVYELVSPQPLVR